jgi:hypothetical protein
MDFATRYADDLERLVQRRMREVGVPEHLIGNPDVENGIARRTFFPQESEGGGVVPGLGINVDSGILDPHLLGDPISVGVAAVWSSARLRDRIDAIIGHEYEEAVGGDHDTALKNAPNTSLKISQAARQILRLMAGANP